MSERLVEIKAQLLEARKEAEHELNTIDKALDAIGVQREAPTQIKRTSKKKSNTRPLSVVKMDRILQAVKDADRPIRTAEVAERLQLGREGVGKALSWLRQEGKIRQVGTAPGKGKIPVYVAVEGEISEALKPERPEFAQRPEVARIEDEQRRFEPARPGGISR